MLTNIHKYIRKSSPKSIVHWQQHLTNLKAYQQEHIRRYLLSPGYESGGVKLLRHILNFTDYDVLRKYPNDYQRYSRYINFIKDDLGNIFDPVAKGLSFNNMFVSKLQMYPTSEYLFPIEDIDHLKLLPFDKPFEYWENLKPLTLWYHNSPELSQHLLQDRFKYSYIQPTYAIIFIDVVTLTFMYFKFLEGKPRHEFQWASREFIHKYVIKNFYYDALNVWLLQQVTALSKCDSLLDVERLHRQCMSSMDNRYGYIGGRYNEASIDLFNELQYVKKGNTTISSFCSSNLFTDGSILDKLDYSNEWLDIPNIRQYKYLRLLRDLPYLDLIINLYKYVPNISDMQSAVRDLRVSCRKIVIDKTWSDIRNVSARIHVQEEFDRIYENLMQFNV